MKKILAIIILISSIPLINNCAGAGGAAAGPNTAIVLQPAAGAIGWGQTRTVVVVGTGRNWGTTTFAPVWRTGYRTGIVVGGVLSGAVGFW